MSTRMNSEKHAKLALQPNQKAVSCIMRADPNRFARSLSDAEHDLKVKKNALIEELMRRALMQNPELARELKVVEEQQETVKDLRQAETISLYHEWKEKRDSERIANRKIKYDDKRNYNKLNAIRRDSYYKSLPRIEQIEIEIARYWKPYNLPLPPELESERNALLAASSMKAG